MKPIDYINAVHTLKRFCEEHINCNDCPLYYKCQLHLVGSLFSFCEEILSCDVLVEIEGENK